MTDDREGGSAFGRFRRYARVSATAGGVAARAAGRRYLGGDTSDTGVGAEDLTAALGGLKGPLMKVAQILTTVPDAMPETYAEQLATLQTNAPHMGWPFVKRRMAGHSPNWSGEAEG